MHQADQPELAHLQVTVERLAVALARLERRRRQRRGLLAVGLVAAMGGFLLGAQLSGQATAQPAAQRAPTVAADPAAREALLDRLTAEQRRELERWERDVTWVSQYMHLSGDRFDPGAMIAVMLARMARAVEAVPEMRTEMQVMNAKMNALPVMAAEVQGINGKMGIMAAGMDSTLGRAGRMMPWNW